MKNELTIEDIQKIVAKDESRYLELKQSTGELYKAMASACAFLNTAGGWVIFGVTPKLKIIGQNVSDSTRQEIANALRKFEPAIDIPVQYIEISKKENFYVIALCFKPPIPAQTPYTFDSRPYYKVENTTAIMPREMFEERIRRSNHGLFCWEKLKCNISLDEIDRDLLYRVVSPVNPKIADVFFKSGLMESWGRGITNIFDECEKHGLPTPEFKIGHRIVTLIIRFKNSLTPHEKSNGPINGPINDLLNDPTNDLLKNVIEIIRRNPGIQKPAIVNSIGKSESTIKRSIKQLVERNIIEFIGPNKTGGYYLKK